MNNIQFKFNEIMRINRKRKIELEDDIDNYQIDNYKKKLTFYILPKQY